MQPGECFYKNNKFLLVDIPGTYSIMSNSEEEEIARNYICFGNPDATVVVVDATCLERNLNLVFQIMEITDNIIVCVNLLDEAKKKKIKVDLEKLSKELGVPVVGTIARKKKSLDKLKDVILKVCSKEIIPTPNKIIYSDIIENGIKKLENKLKNYKTIPTNLIRWISLKIIDDDEKILKSIEDNFSISIIDNTFIQLIKIEILNKLKAASITSENIKDTVVSTILKQSENICKTVIRFNDKNYSSRDRKIDKILTSKTFGFPIMFLFLGLIFWITIVGANYPSQILFSLFSWFQQKLIDFSNFVHCPLWLSDMLINGVYQTLTWIISVMLPPMAIFFPLFTFLEDLGYLPRIAFNMDGFFKKCCCTGKQMITMCMGFGCNAAGCVGCRIINSPRERLIAILTNNFVPCNGRFPLLISIATIFIAGTMQGIRSIYYIYY